MKFRMPFREPSNSFLYAAASILKRIALFHRSLWLRQMECKGVARDGSTDFVLNYIGEGESWDYLKNLFFSDPTKEKQSAVPIWSLRDRVRQLMSSDSPVFVEVNRLLDRMVPGGGFHTFPWIRQKVFMNDRNYLDRKRKIEETFGRKVRKNNYRACHVADRSSVKVFHEEFYVPYMKNQHGDTSHVRSMHELRSAVRTGFLLQVFDGNSWVSGAICRQSGATLSALAFGLRPDYDYHLRQGALSAVYYFMFQWASENSVEVVDLCRSRPHADNGVFEHKRRWGAICEMDEWPHISTWIFVPEPKKAHAMLNRNLVWHKNEFVELGELSMHGSVVPDNAHGRRSAANKYETY